MRKILFVLFAIGIIFSCSGQKSSGAAGLYVEVTAKEANELIKSVNPFILDVRTDAEYATGHIPNSTVIPVQILSENLDKLEEYKDMPIFVYCRSGNRSTTASKILIEEGFTKVYNLKNGIGDWQNQGLPIVTD